MMNIQSNIKTKFFLLLLLSMTITSCVKKNSVVTHFTDMSERGKKTDYYYIDILENDTLHRNVFTLQKTRIRDEDVYMLSHGYTSDSWSSSQKQLKLLDKQPVKSDRYHRLRDTLHDLSLVLNEVGRTALLDSLRFIVITTEDVVEVGIIMSPELQRVQIASNDNRLKIAVKKTSLEEEFNKVLNKYGLKVTHLEKMYDSKECYLPINYVPVREMDLRLKCNLPPTFVKLTMMIEVRNIHAN